MNQINNIEEVSNEPEFEISEVSDENPINKDLIDQSDITD